MRGLFRAVLLIVGLMLVLVQCAPAFTVTSIIIDPSCPMTPGTAVIVTGKIDFTPSGGVTYDGTRALHISTSLVSAHWDCSVLGETPIYPGGAVINHYPQCPYDISSPFYPKNDDKPIKFTVEGKAPAVNGTTNITLLRIQEYDENGSPVPGSLYEKRIIVVDVRDIVPFNTTLERFRARIDEKKAMGVNVSAAEENISMQQGFTTPFRMKAHLKYFQYEWLRTSSLYYMMISLIASASSTRRGRRR